MTFFEFMVKSGFLDMSDEDCARYVELQKQGLAPSGLALLGKAALEPPIAAMLALWAAIVSTQLHGSGSDGLNNGFYPASHRPTEVDQRIEALERRVAELEAEVKVKQGPE